MYLASGSCRCPEWNEGTGSFSTFCRGLTPGIVDRGSSIGNQRCDYACLRHPLPPLMDTTASQPFFTASSPDFVRRFLVSSPFTSPKTVYAGADRVRRLLTFCIVSRLFKERIHHNQEILYQNSAIPQTMSQLQSPS